VHKLKRYLGNTNTVEVHDTHQERSACQLGYADVGIIMIMPTSALCRPRGVIPCGVRALGC
jgi:hypothetical protein